MHRRKDLYGEDAREYRPERWEDMDVAQMGWAYLPFHGGPRLCLGSETSFNSDLQISSMLTALQKISR